MEYKTIDKKLVIIINKNIEIGRAMNAIAHLSLGLTNIVEDIDELRFQDYIDKSNIKHYSISDIPYIVLKAKESQIRNLKQIAIDKNIKHTDFIDTMIGETYVDQHEKTNETDENELKYFAIAMFGDRDEIQELTKKFSLYK